MEYRFFCINCGYTDLYDLDDEVIRCPKCGKETMMNVGNLPVPIMKSKRDIKKFLHKILNPDWKDNDDGSDPKEFTDLLYSYFE